MKVLVTGGAGFIGSHVCDRLAADGHETVILDDLSSGQVTQIHPRARFYQMGIDSPWLDELFAIERPEAVAHYAAQKSVRLSVDDPVFDAQVNVLGTVRLLHASVQYGVRRFVFASTGGAIYGETTVIPTPESRSPAPVSPYGTSKLAAEQYLAMFQAVNGLSCVALRFANVYGPRQDPLGEAGVIAIFTNRLLAGEQATIYGDGQQTRDFVYVVDAAEANALALASPATGAFNVGTGQETDINQIFAMLAELTGSVQPARNGPAKPGEQRRSAIDSSRIQQVLGWRPRTDLKAGLTATVEAFLARAPAAGRPAH